MNHHPQEHLWGTNPPVGAPHATPKFEAEEGVSLTILNDTSGPRPPSSPNMPLRVGSLCTGYAGIEIGLHLAGVGVDLRWVAETEPALASFHTAPNHGDITRTDWPVVEPVDLITAGFPCTPTSAAGRRLGKSDPRWLWPAVHTAIAALHPPQVLIENVRGLLSYRRGRLWAAILDDLTNLGYGVRWLTLGACHVGAAHHRHRLFALASHGQASVYRIPTTVCGLGGLLPTPRAGDAIQGPGYHNNRNEPGSITSATQPQHWAQFTQAVARQEAIYGPAPPPTEPNRNGNPRLSAAFAEWLMCLPPGHVTNHLPRVAALHAIGNGVCPPSLAAAWSLLTDASTPVQLELDWQTP